MPDPETPTPPAGTDASLTPPGGTEQPPPATQETEQEPPVVKRYKEQAAGASAEAQRQRARADYAENLLRAQQQERARPAEPVAQPKQKITPKQFNDAIVEGNETVIQAYHEQLLETAVERTEQKIYGNLNEREAVQRRAGVFDSMMRSTPGLADPKTGFLQEVVNEYKDIQADPWIENKTPNLQVVAPGPENGGQGVWVNADQWRQAIKRAEIRRTNGKAAAAEEVRQSQDSFTEPSGKGSGAAPGQKPQHGNTVLLTAAEEEQVKKIQRRDPNYKRETYWKYMDADKKTARLRAGRAE